MLIDELQIGVTAFIGELQIGVTSLIDERQIGVTVLIGELQSELQTVLTALLDKLLRAHHHNHSPRPSLPRFHGPIIVPRVSALQHRGH